MEINFELPGIVDADRIEKEMLPVGYELEQMFAKRYHVVTTGDRIIVGMCVVAEPFVKISFVTKLQEGQFFMQAFAERFPEHDPKTLFFGFVLRSPDGLYELDSLPLRQKSKAVKEIKNYVSARNAFLVSFYRGDWTDTSMEVQSMRKVLGDGVLGDEKGPRSLTLSIIDPLD